MLHYETIAPETLGLLKTLQNISEFNKLRLVGGTALALQIGHRRSIDLDFFGKLDLEDYEIYKILNSIGTTEPIKTSKNIKIFLINDIKVDFVNYPYNWLMPSIKEDNLTLASIKDIAAMKLEAVSGRGTRKDFVDIFFLLKSFSLKELIKLYKKKFNVDSEFMVLRSLAYFNDAENDEYPEMTHNILWDTVKEDIRNALRNYELS